MGFDDLLGGLVGEQRGGAKQKLQCGAEAAMRPGLVQRRGLVCERAINGVEQVVSKYDICAG
jgi:hypothetical protein